jgi:hypothetical protein
VGALVGATIGEKRGSVDAAVTKMTETRDRPQKLLRRE